jgi:D-arabinitol 4-dehydrogenase
LEDNLAAPFPELQKVGVKLVNDVDPFEEAKIRILNGGHTALAYLGALAGHSTFDQAMRDPVLRRHIEDWETNEVLPSLSVDLPFDKLAYWKSIAARFGNRAIADNLDRICMDGWSKIPIYIRPTLSSCLAQGIVPEFGFLSVASWYVFARRANTGETQFPYHEPYWDTLEPLLASGCEAEFASVSTLWGDLPRKYNKFVPGITAAITLVEEQWPV